jgi:hypothetical protein
MPKRRADADGRRFLDEFTKIRISRFRALNIVNPSRNYALIPVGEKTKLLYTVHSRLKDGGGWSYFICPKCSRRAVTLYLIHDAPRCVRCCRALNIWHRSRYGFGRSERLRARDAAFDELIRKLETGERLRVKTPAHWRGRAQFVGASRRLTLRMRGAMVALRLNWLARQRLTKAQA